MLQGQEDDGRLQELASQPDMASANRTRPATEIETERRPSLAARYQAALDAANTLDRDDPRWRAAMDVCLALYLETRRAATRG